MTLAGAWRRELAGVTAGALLLLAAGLQSGTPALFLSLGLSLYLAWQLRQLYRLSLWLAHPKRHAPPVGRGVWREIVHTVDALRSRDRKRKRKLERMLAGFRESTNALPDATVVLNARDEVQWWNRAAGQLLGLKRKRGKGLPVVTVMRDPVFESYLRRGDFRHSLQIPAPVSDALRLEVRIVPYGKGKRLLQARDITRLLQLETVRRDFVANVSHEMRTPLTVVHGYLESMEGALGGMPGRWGKVIRQMQQQTGRMQRIVEDLLLLSRLEQAPATPRQEPMDVPSLIRRLHAEALALSGGQHRITLRLDAGLWLDGTVTEIESAFNNLVVNALRYTPAGGAIELEWGRLDGAPAFSVRDAGIGIAAEHLPRLSERFYRVDVGRSRQSGGTGLGLAIVKHVLMRHGGRLEIESEPGRGSLFRCRFPQVRARRAVTSSSGS